MNPTLKKQKEENLLLYDIEQFLEKYTRFMTKNIYISLKMHDRFLAQYHYLYDILEKEKLLYSGNSNYQQAINFYKNQKKLLRLHNLKYLKESSKKYQEYFTKLYPKDILDGNKQNTILSMEDQLTFINSKHSIPFIVAKIKYLVEKEKYLESKILIIVPDEEKATALNQELKEKELFQARIMNLNKIKQKFLKEKERLLEEKLLYQIIRDYLIYELFPDKKKFTEFYQNFGNYIYLNKDYKEFDTFRDYHHYLYKRKYLSTNLSLKKYNEQEIKKRRNHLRTICNEIMNSKIEVDIANFLYLNHIPYHYHQEDSTFLLYPENKDFWIKYQKGSAPKISVLSSKEMFLLYETDLFGKNALETLVYELIKRRYPMERREEETVYEQLKDTTKDSYFNEFIHKQFLPYFYHHQNQKMDNYSNLSKEQNHILEKLVSHIEEKITANHLVSESILYERISSKINEKKLDYVILFQEEQLNIQTKYLRILEQYKEISFIKENIKFSQECKKYLSENKQLPVSHCFLDLQEIKTLNQEFLKKNLKEINQSLASNQKPVCIYLYNDQNRLRIPKEISEVSSNLIISKRKEKILIGLNQLNEINPFISFSNFEKLEKNRLLAKKDLIIYYEELKKTNQSYDIILLPYLLPDRYHEDLLDQYYEHHIKMTLLAALSKSKKEVWILCPISQKEKPIQMLEGLKNVKFQEENV